MRLLLLGASGQLGQAILSTLSFKELGWKIFSPAWDSCDLSNGSTLSEFIDYIQPDIIINAAAYTSVDQAEVESVLAYRVNTQAVAILAEAAKRKDALLVHFSTDYVFDGHGHIPLREEDLPAPLNFYGLSKLLGEQAISASGCNHLILRTSWLHSPYRQNFLKTMLRLGAESSRLFVVCDQIGAPTSAAILADASLVAIKQTLANPMLSGLYHVAAKGEVSWFDYASFIFKESRKMGILDHVPTIIPVETRDYICRASRPLNSRLNTYLFNKTFGFHFPSWQIGVIETLQALAAESLIKD